MKVHFAAAYATGVSINAVETVDAGSATVVWDGPGVIFLKLLAIPSRHAEVRKSFDSGIQNLPEFDQAVDFG